MAAASTAMTAPRLGILGGGQLGRMIALAAAPLGVSCHIFDPDPDAPARDVSAQATCAGFDNAAALERFASQVDMVTLEFENVPVSALQQVARLVPVAPGPRSLAVTQDRWEEKSLCHRLGIATAPTRPVDDLRSLEAAIDALGLPGILKTRRLGYDGKGQALVATLEEARAAFGRLGAVPCVLEGLVAFEREISVIVARTAAGASAAFDAVENRHRSGILDVTLAPATLPPGLAAEAQGIAVRLADHLEHVGILSVEMFVTADGLAVNELAPRVHNSGHWTIEGAVTSQFEQHVRAVLGLPLGSTARVGDAVMINLIGDEVHCAARVLATPDCKLHLYGKRDVRAGRKMGHVTRVQPLHSGPDPAPLYSVREGG
ncbi:5-(carboxyamino)imidazole ribonucleotide synthase [Zavarzinia sp. CC-PAN008]|uniref:5-(carboxyamino)imidazole ribonucleotide synthase n=1 Tax=Zavarzinia sp. CC-PAN008 TaxID=3243332 RepID=UPI003F74A1FD